MNTNSNIVLIGMPGSGKTTIGSVLANTLNKSFFDTDDIVKQSCKMSLSEVVEKKGYDYFLDLQNKIILEHSFVNTVIATGGAVVLSIQLMNFLKSIGKNFFLDTTFDILYERLDKTRTLAKTNNQTFNDIYCQRKPLYEKYADEIIWCYKKNINEIVNEIILKID